MQLRILREVAIKTLPEEFLRDPERLARFRREARAASALNHPHICTVHDLGEHEGHPFIVMELLDGETLRAKMEQGPLPLDEVLDIGAQLSKGLETAHAQGIVHRRYQAGQRLRDALRDGQDPRFRACTRRRGRRIADHRSGKSHRRGDVLGTVSYMSPEQARGEELDARSDMFSVGVVLYEMTTGCAAFRGKTTAWIIDRLLNHPVEPPTRSSPNLPGDLDKLISGLLTKDRNQRSTTAHEVGRLLRKIRENTGSRPAPTPGPEKKSIAVLPFENRSADPDNEYFSDGLTDEIIADLSQIKGLRVISRNSSKQLMGSGQDLQLRLPETS